MKKRSSALAAGMVLVFALLAGATSACGDLSSDRTAASQTTSSAKTSVVLPSSITLPSSTTVSRATVAPSSTVHTTSTTLHLSYRSREGRPVEAIVAGSGQPLTLIIGGIHGDEPEGVRLARAVADRLAQDPSLTADRTVVMVPVVNPDGVEHGSRKNAAGIDINRNFPTRDFDGSRADVGPDSRYWGGVTPASEPETRLILDLADRLDPSLIVMLHAPLACVNFDGPAGEAATTLAEASGLPLEPDIGYGTPRSLGTYFGRERDIAVITLELARGGNDLERLTNAIALVILSQ